MIYSKKWEHFKNNHGTIHKSTAKKEQCSKSLYHSMKYWLAGLERDSPFLDYYNPLRYWVV